MPVFQKEYDKNSFLIFLKDIKVDQKILNKFKSLPEYVEYKNSKYKLNIIKNWYDINMTYYNFEINYFSEESVEFLFYYKIFKNLDQSINYAQSQVRQFLK